MKKWYFVYLAVGLATLAVLATMVFGDLKMPSSSSKPADSLAAFKLSHSEIKALDASKANTLLTRYNRLSKAEQKQVKRYADKIRVHLFRMPKEKRRTTHENKHVKPRE